MIEQAPRRIAAIPADINVFGLGREDECINRQMGFKEAPWVCASKIAARSAFAKRTSIQGE